MRKGIRDFALSRIQAVKILEDDIEPHLKSLDIKSDIDSAHGIFFEGKREEVVLRFNEKISDYVREQVWFPGQTLTGETNGDVTLSFSVTDFRELVREILFFGADVEVVEPVALREIIKAHIKKLSRKYGESV